MTIIRPIYNRFEYTDFAIYSSCFLYKMLLLSLTVVFSIFFSSLALSGITPIYSQLENTHVFQGDFEAIKKRGKLRIVIPSNIGGGRYLPRQGSPVSEQQDIAQAFARFHNLTPEFIIVNHFEDIIPTLEQGLADMAVANLTITPQRIKKISFSIPLAHIREKVLVSNDNKSIKSVRDLNDKKIMVSKNSTFWDSLNWLKKNKYKKLNLMARPKGMTDEEELDLLVKGDIDATIRDSNIVDMYLGYRTDFKVAVNFSRQRDIAWGVRKQAPALLYQINEFLHLEHLNENNKIQTGDFDSIKERKVLRVLLRNNASSYFLYKGELLGFEYEMARGFAKKHGLRLEVIVPPSHEELLTWLVEGRADLAIGFLEPTAKRKALGITFSDPYHYEFQHLVVHKKNSIKNIAELNNQSINVRKSSAYWDALKQLKQSGIQLTLVASPEDMETEEIIREVGKKTINMTLSDGHTLDIELTKSKAIKSAFTVGEERPQAVAMRNNNRQLLAAINAFIKKNHKSKYYNVLYKKYFTSRTSIKKLAKGRIENIDNNKLSPYDKITQKYAEQYGFDWRLITAQMYQESRFNPNVTSFAGAQGLMQLMPKTAESLGVNDISNPTSNIKGGIKYMDWLRDRFDKDLPISEQIWFMLAAYNAGYGHVKDAQRLAYKKGWDDQRWFGHTEKAMLLLAKKAYSKQARYGYVDGGEPVNYVRKIRDRYVAYSKLKLNRVIEGEVALQLIK